MEYINEVPVIVVDGPRAICDGGAYIFLLSEPACSAAAAAAATAHCIDVCVAFSPLSSPLLLPLSSTAFFSLCTYVYFVPASVCQQVMLRVVIRSNIYPSINDVDINQRHVNIAASDMCGGISWNTNKIRSEERGTAVIISCRINDRRRSFIIVSFYSF